MITKLSLLIRICKNAIIPLLYIILIGMIGTSWLDYQDTRQALRISALEQARLVAEMIKGSLATSMRAGQIILPVVSKNPSVSEVLQNPPPSVIAQASFLMPPDSAEFSFLESIDLFDIQGQLVASSLHGDFPPSGKFFVQAALAGQPSRGGPIWNKSSNPLYFIALPVKIDDKTIGVITATINLNALSTRWNSILKYTSADRAVIYDGSTVFMDSSGPTNHEQNFPAYLINNALSMASSQEGAMDLIDPDLKTSMLAWYASVPKTRWKLLVLASNDTVFAPARELRNRTFWINATGATLAAFLIWLLLRLQRKALRKAVDLSIAEVGEELAALPQRNNTDDISTIYQSLTIAFSKLKAKAMQAENIHHELEMQIKKAEKSNRLTQQAHAEVINYKNHLEQMVEERTQTLLATQARLEYEQSLLRTIFDTIPDMIFFKDLDRRYVSVNKAFELFCGLDKESIHGYRDEELFPHATEFYDCYRSSDLDALAGTEPVRHEESGVINGGTPVVFDVTKIACFTESGEKIGVLSVAHNMTDRKEAENALIRAKEKAQEASHAKGEFLARMSHEIRTPMNGIIGMAYLAMQADPDEKQLEFLRKIHNSAKALLNIINDILDFSKIEAGKMQVELVSFDLEKLMCSILDTCRLESDKKKLHLSYTIDDNVPNLLYTDSLRLHQILLNLLGNAIKFTDHGFVKVSITALTQQNTPPSFAQFWDNPKKQLLLQFSIADCGIGMTKEQVAGLFQSFSQADGSITRRFGGTGLGLAISKRLAELMHGDIVVTSEKGKGSVFTLYMPVDLAHGELAQERPQQPTANLRGKHLLLVEDNSINQEIAGSLLEHMGISYDVAENGEQAVQKARAYTYDLILMDIQMPVMDGLSATKLLRTSDMAYLHKVPIVAITANAMRGDHEKSIAAGMNDHISKPFDPTDFKAVLQRWLLREN